MSGNAIERPQVARFYGEEAYAALSPVQELVVQGLCLGGRPLPRWSDLYDAEKKDRVAACHNGCAHFLGRGAALDQAKAVELWEVAAAAFEPYSVYFLALYHRHVAKDKEKAGDLFIRASDLGMREAYADAGLCWLKRGDRAKAVKEFEKGSTEKIYACKYHLAMCHWEKKEYKEAFKLLREAAEHGETDLASYQLGIAYMNGLGIEQDKLTAVKHLQPSAEKGNSESQYLIGSAYLTVKAKAKRARKWLVKAANAGHALAQYRVGLAWLLGPEDELFDERSVEKAEELLKSAAEKGVAGAQLYFDKGEAAAVAHLKKQDEPKKLCSACRKPAEKNLMRCGKCKITGYCSAECQKTDWATHKLICGKGKEK